MDELRIRAIRVIYDELRKQNSMSDARALLAEFEGVEALEVIDGDSK